MRKAPKNEIKQIPVGRMFIDYAEDGGYQRPKHEENALAIAEGFDASRYEPIHVSLRDDGRYAVVEGQTRYWVAILLGFPSIQSIVHEGLTRAQEAQLAVDLWGGRRAGSAFDRYRGRLGAGDPATVALNALVEACGWRVAQGFTSGRVIRAVTSIEAGYKQHGAEALKNALWLLEPWAEDHVPSGTLVHGLVEFVGTYGERVDLKRLRSKLEKLPAATIERRAKAKGGGTGIGLQTYVALEILAEWNKGRRKTGHLEALADDDAAAA